MKKHLQKSLILFVSAIMISIYLFLSKQSEEAIIFFPILDPSYYFEHASTHLHSITI